jgi:peroxiredoxin
VQTLKDKPFVLLGVNINCHTPEKLKEVMTKEQLDFRSFTDTEAADGEGLGVIGSTWNLDGTPTLYVVDHKGIIRYRRLGIPDKKAIDEVLDTLLKEAEAIDKQDP